MALFGMICLLAALFLVLRKLYDRFWDTGLSCELHFQEDYAVEDDVSTLSAVIVNDKLLPMPVVEIDFHMDKRLQFGDGQNSTVSDQSYRRDVFALSVRQKITRTLEFNCTGRGYFRIDEAGLTTRDLFLTREYHGPCPQNTEFYVLPRPVPTEQVNIPFSRVMGTILSRKKVYDDPFEFAGLREYSRGDPMKYINWKATARAGELLTNLHESTLSQRVILLLDMEGVADPLNEASVRIACSLCHRLLLSGVELSVYSNGRDVQGGETWRLEGLLGENVVLYMKKKFACVKADNGLPEICGCLPKEMAVDEDDLLVLVSRRQRQELADDFAGLVGKGKGVQVIPCRLGEHKELSSSSHVDMVWMEV